ERKTERAKGREGERGGTDGGSGNGAREFLLPGSLEQVSFGGSRREGSSPSCAPGARPFPGLPGTREEGRRVAGLEAGPSPPPGQPHPSEEEGSRLLGESPPRQKWRTRGARRAGEELEQGDRRARGVRGRGPGGGGPRGPSAPSPAACPGPPRPRPAPAALPLARPRAAQSPPRGAGGRAATPSGSLPPAAARISFQPSFRAFQRPPSTQESRGREDRSSDAAASRQAGLKLLGSSNPPTLASQSAGITGPTGAPPSGALEGKAGTITSNEWSSPNSPEGSNVSGSSQALDKPIDNDAEGVWSPDIEQSFQEALAIYPPCGRRKIILSDEGKMYGRNELIARYIKLRTGKTRTRKQVSSHIQVLARRKAREIQAKLKDQAAKDKALQSMAAMSSAQIISATAFHSSMALARGPGRPAVSGFWQGALPGQAGTSHDVKPFSQQTYAVQHPLPLPGFESPAGPAPSPSAPPAPPWQGRSVASSKLWMLEFSAFLEQQQDPDTADLNTNIEDEGSSFYGVSSQYESPENMIITCSTKVCSFGKQVVEKVETEYARYENGHYSYRIHRSPLCEYMVNFIHKLKHLPEKYMMNSVLENFTILQVVTNRDTQETLLCIAYVFEVSASEHGAQHHIYRLVKE
uniref:TEA domain transcription factor 4 n=1 Tax=Callithrix jacchus TaxID=9483 RepID=A0A8I3X2G5_CALJA